MQQGQKSKDFPLGLVIRKSPCGLSCGIPHLCIYGYGCRLYRHYIIEGFVAVSRPYQLEWEAGKKKRPKIFLSFCCFFFYQHLKLVTMLANHYRLITLSTKNGMDTEVTLLMFISSCSLSESLIPSLRLRSSHQCTRI